MKIVWAIQTNLIDYEQSSAVCVAAKAAGAEVCEVEVIPFVDDVEVPDLDTDLVIPYGSTKLNKISQKRRWLGNWYSPKTFNVAHWNNVNGDKMLNYDASISKVSDLVANFRDDDDTLYFIRPLHDLKQFNGTVAPAKEIKNWMSSVYSGNFSFDENTEVCISSVKNISSEIRCFIVGGQLIDCSYYRIAGVRLSQPVTNATELDSIRDFLSEIILPHDCCVADIAYIGKTMKVIEFNSINSSGFYYNNIDKIVAAMTEYLRDYVSPKDYALMFDYGCYSPFWLDNSAVGRSVDPEDIYGLSKATIMMANQIGQAWADIQWKVLDISMAEQELQLPKDLKAKYEDIQKALITLAQMCRRDCPLNKFTVK